jgi:hypothetical protein
MQREETRSGFPDFHGTDEASRGAVRLKASVPRADGLEMLWTGIGTAILGVVMASFGLIMLVNVERIDEWQRGAKTLLFLTTPRGSRGCYPPGTRRQG